VATIKRQPYRSTDAERLLARLIGPPGPELSCEECFEQLDRHVQLELAGSDADAAIPGMQEHLEGCLACVEDRESLRALLLVGYDARNCRGEVREASGSCANKET
jgi:hypothetical protein